MTLTLTVTMNINIYVQCEFGISNLMTVTAKEKSKSIIYPCLSQALSLFVAAAYLPDPSSPRALAS